MPVPPEPTRFLLLPQIRRLIGYSNSHLKRLEAAGKFPKRVRLGDGRPGWVFEEYEEYCAARIAEREEAA
jgi:prophage regulatory protein